jgi:arylsulfatase A-like enzyme
VRHLIAHYDGTVTYADTWLGVFVEALRRRGLLERTLLFVSGDHGESLGETRGLASEDGRFGHGWSLVNWQIHVPLAVSGPGVAAGRRVTDAVELIDLAPTVLELCGISPDRRHQGESLAAQLRPGASPASDPGRVAFSCSPDQVTARTSRWQLIRGEADGGRSWRLYDLPADPLQRRDVSAEHPEEAALLRSKLLDWLEQTVPTGRTGPSRLEPQGRDTFRTFGYW